MAVHLAFPVNSIHEDSSTLVHKTLPFSSCFKHLLDECDQPPTDASLGCLSSLAITNNAAAKYFQSCHFSHFLRYCEFPF